MNIMWSMTILRRMVTRRTAARARSLFRRMRQEGRPSPRSSLNFFQPLEPRVLLSTVSASTAGGFFDPIEDMGRVDRSSDNGQYVVLNSSAALVAADTNGVDDIYLYDRMAGTVTLVSHNAGNSNGGNAKSFNPQISRDGDTVVFSSIASDLVPGDANGLSDVFLYNRTTGAISLISHVSGGPASAGAGVPDILGSDLAVLSGDGAWVAYLSDAPDLAAGDSNDLIDVFLYNRATNTNLLVSQAFGGGGSATGGASRVEISSDGGYLVFQDDAADLTATPDANGADDLFLYNRLAGTTNLISQIPGNTAAGDQASFNPSINDDGQIVSFTSTSTDLSASDTNGLPDVFLYDRASGNVTLVSKNAAATDTGNGSSFHSQVSGDGSYVVYVSLANDLTAVDSNGAADIFLYDRVGDSNLLISHNLGNTDSGNGISDEPLININGKAIVFVSTASDLVASDTNGQADVFLYERLTDTISLASQNAAATDSAANGADTPVLSHNGGWIAFNSYAPDDALVGGATDNGQQDVFLTQGINIGPEINLTGGLGYAFGGGPKVIIDSTATFTDSVANLLGGNLTVEVTLMNTAADVLGVFDVGAGVGQINVAGPNIRYDYGSGQTLIGTAAGGTGVGNPLIITFTANAQPEAVEALIRAITYRDTDPNTAAGNREITFIVDNGAGQTTPPVFATLYVEPNVAPTITSPVNPLTTILEDAVVNNGDRVADLIAGFFGDTNVGSPSGIAVTLVDNSNGAWEYSADDGATWTAFGNPGNAQARLLPGDNLARVRFVPGAEYSGSASFTFRAWDQSAGLAYDTANTNTNGGSSPFSATLASSTITITNVNDAPLITIPAGATGYTEAAAPALITTTGTVTDIDSANFNTGNLTVWVSADGDADDRLTVLHEGTGNGQISVVGNNVSYGAGPTLIGTFTGGNDGVTPLVVTLNGNASVAATQALLRRIAYSTLAVTFASFSRTISFTADDGAGATSAAATRDITITNINDAPVLTGPANSFSAIDEDDLANPGDEVADIIAGRISDPDGGAALEGIAITAVGGNGAWEYSLNGGATWSAVGAVANASALLLTDLNFLRFLPVSQFSGASSLTYRAWDQSSGVAGTKVSTVANGGATAFSTATLTSSITVNNVNDAPVITIPAGATGYTEAAAPALITTTGTVSDIDSPIFNGGNLTVWVSSDADADDRLTVLNEGAGVGQIAVAGGNVSYNPGAGSVLIGSFTGGDDGVTPLLISLSTADATVAATQALLRRVAYSSTAVSFASLSRVVSFTANDGAGATSAAATRDITITNSNDAPVLAGPAIDLGAINEDDSGNSGTLISNILTGRITDPDGGISLEGIAITTVGGNGTWQYSLDGGGIWTNFPAVANNNALLLRDSDLVRLQPSANFNGTSSLTYRAWDQTSGTAGTRVSTNSNGGATAFSTATLTSNITVNAVNDAMTIGSFTGSTNYTENAAAVILSTTATVADADSPDFNGGNLTASISGNADAGDRLTIVHQGTANGQIAVSGGNISYNPGAGSVLIGTMAGGTDGSTPLVVTFTTAAATPAAVQALLRRLAYSSTADAFPAASRTVSVTIDDGDGSGATAAGDRTVNITTVNDAPVLNGPVNNFTSIYETDLTNAGDLVSAILGAGVSDPDGAAVAQGIAITAVAAGGAWQYSLNGGGTWTAVGVVNNTSALLLRDTDRVRIVPSGAGSSSITYRAWDQSSGAAGTKVTTATNGGTTAFSTATLSSSITIQSAVGLPIIGSFSGASSYTENTAAVILSATATVTDANSLNFNGGNFSAWISAGNESTDQLAIVHQGTAATQIAVAGATISYNPGAGSVAIGTFVGGDGLNALVVTLNANATPAAVQAMLRRLAYSSTADGFATLSRTVAARINDGGQNGNTATRTVNITAVNDAPVLTGPAIDFTTILETDTAANGQLVSDLLVGRVTDPDGPAALQGIAITVKDVVNGTWQYSLNDGGTWTTIGNISTNNLLLRSSDRVRFVPTANSGTTSSLTYRAWDQSAGTAGGTLNTSSNNGGTFSASTATLTSNLTITLVNDTAVLANVPGTTAYTEDDAATWISQSATVTDPDTPSYDGGTLTVWFSANGENDDRLTIKPRNSGADSVGVSGNSITYNNGGGPTVIGTFAGGVNGAPLVATFNAAGTPEDCQAVIRAIAYYSVSNNPSTATRIVSFQINDGTGTLSNIQSRDVTVARINDAPDLAGANNFTPILSTDVNNLGNLVSELIAGMDSDPDGVGALRGIAIIARTATNGAWQFYNPGTGIWTALGNPATNSSRLLPLDARVRFVPTGPSTTSTITIRAWDQTTGTAYATASTNTTGGTTAFSAISALAGIQVL